jgi:type I restriction enzyme M protein
MAKKAAKSAKTDTSANLGFEAKLWLAADKLRNNWMRPSTSMWCSD